ncbi:bifunctional pantoate--beta-alanine ligase/(d)CMP kinase [Baaleninema sp.]|uniref:bifunctional pantoate--beta-alanine ligase/(d)CMP kinase n=1 Tax=Baaleninema sp. TaxID=3101197 RepID=UPI003D03CE84
MKRLTTAAALQAYCQSQSEVTIGLVPTMGNLHGGHLSLIDRARQENDRVIVSIFVNPLQFGPHEDFEKYPRTLDFDCQLCQEAGVDAVFAPSAEELGISGRAPADSDGKTSLRTTVVPPPKMTSILCGRSRPGHFDGVATIVTKLLNLVRPDRAYFGQKDAQQLAIIRQLVRDLSIPVEIVGCPIVREPSGLALSSRNQYLSHEQKETAATLYRSLQQAQRLFDKGFRDRAKLLEAVKTELSTVPEVRLEYLELVDPESLVPLASVRRKGLLAIAARVGETRLIDNLLLNARPPIIAIDGPAGAGKSTVTRQVARTLGLLYLDTGAMYRAVTWWLRECGVSIEDEAAVAEALQRCDLQLKSDVEGDRCRVWVNRQEVTDAIRSPEVTSAVSAVSALPVVRQFLIQQQKRYGETGGLVAEGRDMGTCVFPDAEVKVFLTASVGERARRRKLDLERQGYEVNLGQLEGDIAERDRQDSTRTIAPLKKARDAVEIQTDNLSIDEVTDKILHLVPSTH